MSYINHQAEPHAEAFHYLPQVHNVERREFSEFLGRSNSAANTASSFYQGTVSIFSTTPRRDQRRDQTYEDEPMPGPTHEEIDAKIAAAEARGKTDAVRFEGKLETLEATLTGKMDAIQTSIREGNAYNRTSRLVIISVVFASVFALAAIILAMATYGDALFGRGMNVRDMVQAVVREQQQQRLDAQSPTQSVPTPNSDKAPIK